MQETKRALTIHHASPRGFCAGVERAVEIVELALERYGPPVYVRHEIVHNKRVCDELRAKGARFVEEVSEVPKGAVVIFSAHGVARRVEDEATLRELQPIDATCPLVSKVHREGQRYADQGYDVVLIGHRGHPEITGTLGRIAGQVYVVADEEEAEALSPERPERLAYVTQTTLSLTDTQGTIEVLKRRFPHIIGPSTKDICYASQNRQNAVSELLSDVDLLLVVGAQNSSNSARLREMGEAKGIPSYLIDGAEDLDPAWFEGVEHVGLTAGASAPAISVREVTARLGEWFSLTERTRVTVTETTQFKLPPGLASANKNPQPTV
ncbi:4-hydroxy-3-methylbut-2-enyl diphosphate reductase [Parvularcula maris]|uniref:4-hydroxy-3-methylbut-2-enyl diphosphate reductase n=1 Tax=Parvularcula maris TaxID=2965077 RepID=A0A9X2L652_9PROT|nr:4-hydroxy-3-methylbut-2-enyl diphosphate reductase [Parvularcula maris]MCQ8183777.1 4-hydroxy-3-methylbut-2-enyl diphosphate reductase [Parvularcula maris]